MTYEEAHSLLDYDPTSGLLRWKVSTGPMIRVGAVAGYRSTRDYIRVRYAGKQYQAHRLAWLLANGRYPSGLIDHINGDRTDNRLSNLRDATPAINSQNQRRATVRNKSSGLLGVTRNRAGWQASVRLNGRQHHVGTFKTPEEAHVAYLEAKRRLHPGCTI